MDILLFPTGPIASLLIASLLGAFLGLWREMQDQKKNRDSFMGLRTMSLLCLLGALSTIFPQFPTLPLILFGAITLLIAIGHAHGNFMMQRIGMTSELSAFLTFLIGVLIGFEQQTLAILLTVFLGGVGAFRDTLHKFAKTLEAREWIGLFQLVALSAAVLPFLPREAIDPWGAFVPFHVWLLVMLISGIGFVGYFLIKYLGTRGGIPLFGFLGAIISSTAVTISMAIRSKKNNLPQIFSGGILIALATMQARVALEVVILGSKELLSFLIVPISMSLASSVLAGYFFLKSKNKKSRFFQKPENIKLERPFEIIPALKFGVIFIVVLFALSLGQRYFGDSGVYAAAFLSGIIDIDAIVLSSLEAVRNGELLTQTAQTAIALALFVNTIVKVGYVAIMGSRSLFRNVLWAVGIVTFVGVSVFLLT